jgi:esterase/lipase|tara:strand:+ start:8356 stop:9174 length:819 start_codon:yes stop_codon:yes gene_type:complete
MKKKIIKVTSTIFPRAFTKYAYSKLTQPQSRQLKKNEEISMESAKKSRLSYKNSEIQIYEWENEKKPILLVHGWEGQAGNFSSIIERLLDEKYSVITFDGPSHGLSSKNSGTSLFEFAEVVGVIIEKYQIKNIVSHSFGGVATMYSLSVNPKLIIDNYLLLTTPNKFLDRIETVANHVGISKRVKIRLINRLENELQIDLKEISVAKLSEKVKVKNALIIHDQFDKVLSINESIAVNDVWSASSIESIEGTGHFKILRANFVHDRLIEFFNQ